ncbi:MULTISPECIES: lysophospholipid acyltransferase family protein [unclassified Moraxella]|uniref:lysophospholipid acyltransferase family protein n=1 Tax=unclassified Moraxella TaxID=2685852 RepID=UPI003AF93483
MNGFKLIRYLPMWVLYALATLASWVIGQLKSQSVYRNLHTNLRLVFPQLSDDKREQLQRAVIANQAKNAVESFKCWAMPVEWSIAQIHTVHNQHILRDALADPKGMLAIVPHLGTWEMMNAWLNQFGSPTIMYKPVKGKSANEFVLAGRERLNATLVPTDATGVKAIFKTLKEGGFSIILPDHVPDPSGGVVVPFFGIPTMTSTLAPKLASKTGCRLVGLVCVRRDDGNGFDIHCEDLSNPNLYSKDIETATLAMNHAIEAMILRFPSHYMWNYRRFKYVPNVDDVYALDDNELAQVLATYQDNNLTLK